MNALTTMTRPFARIETKAAAGAAGGDDDVAAAVAELTEATKAAIDGVAGEVKDLVSRLDDIEKKGNRPGVGGDSGEKKGDFEKECKALSSFVRTGNEQPLVEVKTNSVGSDPDGGYLVLPQISTTMTKRIYDLSPMRRMARVETIVTGDAWEEPLDIDDVGASWVGETEQRPKTSSAQVGMLRVPVEEVYANLPVTQRLLDDSQKDIGAWVTDKIGDKFGRLEGVSYVVGDGIKKPRGFLTYPNSAAADGSRPWGTLQTVKSGDATKVTPDGLKDLMWAVRSVYRNGASWLMNSNTASSIDKLKNGQGDYIWRDGMTAGALPSLLGYPVEFDESMPDIGAGALPIAFGNFKTGYLIVDKRGIKLLRDPYTDKPNVLFYAYRRVGGGLAHSEAIKLMQVSA